MSAVLLALLGQLELSQSRQTQLTFSETLSNIRDLSLVSLIPRDELLIGCIEECLQVGDPVIPRVHFAFRRRDLSLEMAVLLDKLDMSAGTIKIEPATYLLLDRVELFQVVLQEFQLSLLSPRVGGSSDHLVLLLYLVQLHFQLDHLFTPVLQILHQALLDNVKFGELYLMCLPIPLELLGSIGKLLVVGTSSSRSEGALHVSFIPISGWR